MRESKTISVYILSSKHSYRPMRARVVAQLFYKIRLQNADFRKRSSNRGIWKRRFVFAWTENILETELFKNDDVTMIITWFPCTSFAQTQIQIQKRERVLCFINFAGEVGKKIISCVFKSENAVFKFLQRSVDVRELKITKCQQLSKDHTTKVSNFTWCHTTSTVQSPVFSTFIYTAISVLDFLKVLRRLRPRDFVALEIR